MYLLDNLLNPMASDEMVESGGTPTMKAETIEKKEKEFTMKGAVIKNVGAVDLRFAEPETIQNIRSISNTGVVLITDKQKKYISNISISNTGMVEELDEEYKIEMGNIDINKSYLECLESPLKVLVVGILSILEDVTVEMVESKIAGIYNIGIIQSSDEIMGSVKAKIVKNIGLIRSFNPGRETIQGKKDVTQAWLESLKDNTNLEVMGVITLIEEFDIELFDRKIESIKLMGVVNTRQKYEAILQKKLGTDVMGKVHIMPDNCDIIKNNAVLDAIALKRMKNANIYSTGTIIIEGGVDENTLANGIGKIVGAKSIYLPEHLLDAIIPLADEEINVIVYKGKLLL
ncbi:MAG: hypothetical protein JXR56_08545, partial [Candidatus Cloacimonetes bacterium]|nr:hypothetical protein [Candidatus Cloacimonadota bacterium]